MKEEVEEEREPFPGFRQFSCERLEMPVVEYGMLPPPLL